MELERPLDALLETGGHVRVLRALAGLPEGFTASARDIARRAGVAHTTAGRVLRSLADHHVVRTQRVGRADLYRLNERHILTPQIRTLFRTEANVRQDLIDYLRIELRRRVGPVEGAFLFGSVGRGTTHSQSDIDVAIVAPRRPEEELESVLAALSDTVRERFGSELNAIVGPSGRSKRSRPKLWNRIEREGISLLDERARRA